MEQKKILWVILIISIFFVVIFGVFWFLYSPSRSKNKAQATTIDLSEYISPQRAAVDPDAWTRNPDSMPRPDESTSDVQNINVTADIRIVSPPKEEDSSTVNVSGLSEGGVKQEGNLPQSLVNDVLAGKTQDSSASSTQSNESTQSSSATQKSSSTVKTGVVSTSGSASSTVKSAKASPNTSASSIKTTTTKTTTKTLYWVQTASLTSRLYAENARDTLQEQNMKAEIFTKETLTGLVHRVRVGPFENKTEASYWLSTIKNLKGFEESFISEERVTN